MILRATTKGTKDKHSESPLTNQSENPINHQVTYRETGRENREMENEINKEKILK